ncbi:CSC1-like protein RXW8 isoform X1 [Zingiber officinale]|uniref:CSC1-like protein RXW8 isoform X1 n=1 Tax=Zingiber officinale TaxID=94328 RepID=UPI001C4AF06E|nr:CSC1-like protein RXW8 isoform X1 [Zingiber officinale]
MKLSALLTSAGINIGVCALLLSLYSVLRKQPGNISVYFGRRLAEEHGRQRDSYVLERFVPSPSWILKAWQYTEEEILSAGGLDAVVFIRAIVFSIRVFSVAASICLFGILPLNYFGQEMHHVHIPSESLDVFNISNVMAKSRWLWVHCLALYIISISACILLYFEYKGISKLRQFYITRSLPNPSQFTVLVRGIPKSTEDPLTDTVRNFFTRYHGPSYLSHQMIYRVGKVQKIMSGAEKVYKKFVHFNHCAHDKRFRLKLSRCGLCGGKSNGFQLFRSQSESNKKVILNHPLTEKNKECAAAFVFFRTRYAALVTSKVLQSSNPMLWVIDLAPEPHDVYWSNLWLPYRQLWVRRISTLLGCIVFVVLFIIPVTFVQGLSQLDQLQQRLPFLKGILKKDFMIQIVTGYLPSVILQLFLYTVPPLMLLFSSVEGPISRSARKKSACTKVLYFTIWNVFFVNVLSGSVINQLNVISSPKDIPTQLAKAVPRQATLFITYVLTSGWASLSTEIMQPFALLWNFFRRYIFRIMEEDPDCILSFPYHTEVPRVLLFGLLGFTCAILAPLILPFLLVYFLLGYVVYRNQIMNVYITRYETGGRMWPIVHNTTIFSLVMAQIIALGVFGLKESTVASGFMIPLLILTLLFNEYCRQRFHPLFKNLPAQDLIDRDKEDEETGRMEQIHEQLFSAYCQFPAEISSSCTPDEDGEGSSGVDKKDMSGDDLQVDVKHPTLPNLPVFRLRQAVDAVSMLFSLQNRNLSNQRIISS